MAPTAACGADPERGLRAALYGLACIVFPAYSGSAGTTWGLLAIAAAALFVTVAEWEGTRDRRLSTTPSTP